MMNSKNKVVILLFLVVFFGTLFLFLIYKQKEKALLPLAIPTPLPTQPQIKLPSTLTQEEIEVVSELETHTVTIESGKVTPQTLEIKLHDQVRWLNQDNKIHQIVGDDWGNVPISPGENFTQAFKEPGTISYSDKLDPGIKGTIIVK